MIIIYIFASIVTSDRLFNSIKYEDTTGIIIFGAFLIMEISWIYSYFWIKNKLIDWESSR